LAQVFVSVQGLIFVDDPMFNEPGFDGLRGTREGEEKSAAYNAEIRLFTVRHAMIDALRKPRRGIAATVKAHFKGASVVDHATRLGLVRRRARPGDQKKDARSRGGALAATRASRGGRRRARGMTREANT
jgi:hypothetical protein